MLAHWTKTALSLRNTIWAADVAADPSIVEVIRDLPPKRRAWLLRIHKKKISSQLSREAKIHRLAEIVGPNGINAYMNQYLPGTGGLITWYVFKDSDERLTDMSARLVKKFPGIEKGIFPKLKPDKPPLVHMMRWFGKSLIVDLAAMDHHKKYQQDWKPFDEPVDHIYRIVIRENPLTIEIRAAYGKIDTVYDAVADALGLDLNVGLRCALDPARIARLKRRLKSYGKHSIYTHQDAEISRSSLESQPKTDLEHASAHKARIAQFGVREFSRVCICTIVHPEDKFPEEVRYQVKIDSGEVRIRNGTSEYAIDVLRNNVIALF